MTLKAEAHLSNEELSKINKEEYMTLQSLENIARYLSKVAGYKIDIGDLVSYE
jgi:DNA-binding Xre family transcriptional regulator